MVRAIDDAVDAAIQRGLDRGRVQGAIAVGCEGGERARKGDVQGLLADTVENFMRRIEGQPGGIGQAGSKGGDRSQGVGIVVDGMPQVEGGDVAGVGRDVETRCRREGKGERDDRE